MTETVLVTGGSGYIAGFLIRRLLDEGWAVRTTVRSAKRTPELKTRFGGALDVRVADLDADAGWAEAAAGCTHVAHVASPFPPEAPRDEQELIRPARDGALRVLRAARDAGVKRFVMTSSTAALSYGVAPGQTRFTEKDWTDPTSPDTPAYPRSKTIAERAARDWVAAEGGDLEFVTINPAAVLGPLENGDLSSSINIVKKALEGSVPGYPDIGFSVVDVRDVADLHHRALVEPGLAGERFIAANGYLTLAEVGAILRRELGPEAKRVPKRTLPNWLVRLIGRFDPVVGAIVGDLSRRREADGSHAKQRLGWSPRPVEQSVVATARSLIDLKIVAV
ncbi:MAG TPA: NAD-dependent epimerase/dehydratase family protein [Sphingomonas sp.]|jgi:dihydroflavonol-4-reductase